jgi:hypothetical protein
MPFVGTFHSIVGSQSDLTRPSDKDVQRIRPHQDDGCYFGWIAHAGIPCRVDAEVSQMKSPQGQKGRQRTFMQTLLHDCSTSDWVQISHLGSAIAAALCFAIKKVNGSVHEGR